jgi:hypothetical protein
MLFYLTGCLIRLHFDLNYQVTLKFFECPVCNSFMMSDCKVLFTKIITNSNTSFWFVCFLFSTHQEVVFIYVCGMPDVNSLSLSGNLGLEPVNLCSTSPLPANRSGVITYDPAASNTNCSLTLTGLNDGDHVSLSRVAGRSPPVSGCTIIETLLLINDQQERCTQKSADDMNIVQISNSQLKLEVLDRGFKALYTIEYYPGMFT